MNFGGQKKKHHVRLPPLALWAALIAHDGGGEADTCDVVRVPPTSCAALSAHDSGSKADTSHVRVPPGLLNCDRHRRPPVTRIKRGSFMCTKTTRAGSRCVAMSQDSKRGPHDFYPCGTK